MPEPVLIFPGFSSFLSSQAAVCEGLRVCPASPRRPGQLPCGSPPWAQLWPRFTQSAVETQPVNGSLVSQPHPTSPHRSPAPPDSLGFSANLSTRTPQPIPAWRGEGGASHHPPPAALCPPPPQPSQPASRGEKGPLVTSRSSAKKNAGGRRARTQLLRRVVSFSRRQRVLDLTHAATSHKMIGSP